MPLYKAHAMSEVVSHLCENADIVHKAKDTMAQYNSILRAIEPSAEEETHTTRFVQQRCTHLPDLMTSTGHHTSLFFKVSIITFHSNINVLYILEKNGNIIFV